MKLEFKPEFYQKHLGNVSAEECAFIARISNEFIQSYVKQIKVERTDEQYLNLLSDEFGREQCTELFRIMEAARCFRLGYRKAEEKIKIALAIQDDYITFLENEVAKHAERKD